jgi:hypothetical protein
MYARQKVNKILIFLFDVVLHIPELCQKSKKIAEIWISAI